MNHIPPDTRKRLAAVRAVVLPDPPPTATVKSRTVYRPPTRGPAVPSDLTFTAWAGFHDGKPRTLPTDAILGLTPFEAGGHVGSQIRTARGNWYAYEDAAELTRRLNG